MKTKQNIDLLFSSTGFYCHWSVSDMKQHFDFYLCVYKVITIISVVSMVHTTLCECTTYVGWLFLSLPFCLWCKYYTQCVENDGNHTTRAHTRTPRRKYICHNCFIYSWDMPSTHQAYYKPMYIWQIKTRSPMKAKKAYNQLPL